MKQLIDEAIQLITDRPDEAKLIHHILTKWDAEMKLAFNLAWNILNDQDIDGKN